MPDDPSLADPYSFFQPNQQPIPQGPTVAATPASTNSLADLANILMPALVGLAGAKANKQPGLLGAMAGAGAGANAMEGQRIQAQRSQALQQEMQYRQVQAQHAMKQMEIMGLEEEQYKKQIANEDETLKTIKDPWEKQLFQKDKASWVKYKREQAMIPGEIQAITNAYPDQYTPEQLAKLPPDTIHALAGEVLKSKLPGEPKLTDIQTPGGGVGKMFFNKTDGKYHMLPNPEELNAMKKPEGGPSPTGAPTDTADMSGFAQAPARKGIEGGRLDKGTRDQLDDGRTVITEGMGALDDYDKVLKKSSLWSIPNLLAAQTKMGSVDPDIERFATQLQTVTNIRAHALFKSRLTAPEMQRLSRELPTLTTATWNSVGFKTALKTTLDLYRTAQARQLYSLKKQGFRVDEDMLAQFPLAEDDPARDPAKWAAVVQEKLAQEQQAQTPQGKLDADTAALKGMVAGQPKFELPEGWQVQITP